MNSSDNSRFRYSLEVGDCLFRNPLVMHIPYHAPCTFHIVIVSYWVLLSFVRLLAPRAPLYPTGIHQQKKNVRRANRVRIQQIASAPANRVRVRLIASASGESLPHPANCVRFERMASASGELCPLPANCSRVRTPVFYSTCTVRLVRLNSPFIALWCPLRCNTSHFCSFLCGSVRSPRPPLTPSIYFCNLLRSIARFPEGDPAIL